MRLSQAAACAAISGGRSLCGVRVLVVDNYDSFVFNLVQYLGQLGVEAQVWRNDDPRLSGESAIAGVAEEFDGVLLSPGPGPPERAGESIALVHACAAARTPLLGVCLGHQAIGVAFGGTVDRAPELLHGKTSTVFHNDSGVLKGLANPFTATRYHSLTILPETVPAELEVTARTETGVIMDHAGIGPSYEPHLRLLCRRAPSGYPLQSGGCLAYHVWRHGEYRTMRSTECACWVYRGSLLARDALPRATPPQVITLCIAVRLLPVAPSPFGSELK